MIHLDLRPIPRFDSEDVALSNDEDECGFVDDEVAMALVAGPRISQHTIQSGDVALAADLDFAGWCLSSSLPPASLPPATEPPAARTTDWPNRRPNPPSLAKFSISESHGGGHRWWLAGLAGALSAMLILLLWLSIVLRNDPERDEASFMRLQNPPAPALEPEPAPTVPSLTGMPVSD